MEMYKDQYDTLEGKERLESSQLPPGAATALAKEFGSVMKHTNKLIDEHEKEMKSFINDSISRALDKQTTTFGKMLIASGTIICTFISVFHFIK